MTDARITAYLLNELSTDEKKAFEERLACDPEFSERVAMIEDEMLDAYVSNELSLERSAQVEKLYLRNDKRRKNLAFAIALRRNRVK